MSFRTALCATASLLLGAGVASAASGAALDSRPAPSATQIEEMRVGEEVGYVFEVDLGAVPGATYVEGLPGETAAAPLLAAAGPDEEVPSAEEPTQEGGEAVVVEDVAVEDMPYEGGVVAEEETPVEGEPEAGAAGEYVEMEEVPADQEAGPEEGDSPAREEEAESSEEPVAEPSEEPAGEPSPEEVWEETPPAPEDAAGAPDGAAETAGD